ncbi:UDP-glucose 4-epimerase [Candidatus Haloredivivus sp. G17]|nr:UDP-glucose 4-epimerase [Candidatus Haloredivivus sp. G17]
MVLNDEPVTIYGDGEQSRDFTYVKDIASGAIKASEKQGSDTYNIASGRRITVNEMVETLDEVMEEKRRKNPCRTTRGRRTPHPRRPDKSKERTRLRSRKRLRRSSQRMRRMGQGKAIRLIWLTLRPVRSAIFP